MDPVVRLLLALFAIFAAVALSIVGASMRRKKQAGQQGDTLTTFEETQYALRGIRTVNVGWSLYCIALYCIWQAVGSAASNIIRQGWAVSVTAYVILWAALNFAFAAKRQATREFIWICNIFDTSVMVANTMFVSTFIWMFMPYCDESAKLLIIIYSFGHLASTIIGASQHVETNRFATLVFLGSVLPVYLYNDGEYPGVITIFSVAFFIFSYILCERVNASMGGSILARRAAEASRQAAEADRDARTRFLASASHDLGQPLQSARLFLDQAFRGTNAERREAAARNARNALGSMERLLRQMLDHLRLDSGGVVPKIERLAIGPLIAHLASQFEPVAAMARVELIALPSRLTVCADPELVERALGNLLDNALRHADANRVLIGARLRGDFVRCWVIDDGCGVTGSEIPGLFDEYVQGPSMGGRERGGFGLGLASVRRFAALMRGETGIEPKWLNGSAFFLDLPIGKALASR